MNAPIRFLTSPGLLAVLLWQQPSAAQTFNRLYDVTRHPGTTPLAPDALIYGKDTAPGGFVGGHFGSRSAVVDLNGDGVDDLVLSTSNVQGGVVGLIHVWFGGAGFGGLKKLDDAPADLTILGASSEDRLGLFGPGRNSFLTGDFNGDGRTDLILAASAGDGPGGARTDCGNVHILFGRPVFPVVLDLAVQGPGGADVTIYGQHAGDFLTHVDTLATGDWNGDGLADLAMGTALNFNQSRMHVVFGRPVFPAVLDLAIAANSDITITGDPGDASQLGGENGGLTSGDVNGDGTDDLIIADFYDSGPGNTRLGCGAVHFIFGRRNPEVFPATLDMTKQGAGGADVTVYGASAQDKLTFGYAPVLAVGDVNGDVTDDVVMASYEADGPGETRAACGEIYVVFGRKAAVPFPAVLDLAVQGNGGADVTMFGAVAGDWLGERNPLVLGDVNGDGVLDIIGGSSVASPGGKAYVVFGRSAPAAFPATLDFAIDGPGGADVTITSAAGLLTEHSIATEDINGDGVDDLILGAPRQSSFWGTSRTRWQNGELYVFLGRGLPQLFPPLVAAESADITIFGGESDTLGHSSTFRTGDLNDDGRPDLVVTSVSGAGFLNTGFLVGEAYVLFGRAGVVEGHQQLAVEHPAGNPLASGTGVVDFGVVNPFSGAVPQTFTLKNTGAFLLGVSAIGVSGPDAGDFGLTPPWLPDVLLPGGEITCDLNFTPLAEGPRHAVLEVTSDDPANGTFTVALTGTGNSPPVLELPASPFVVTATSAAGADVVLPVTASDAEDTPDPVPVATPPSGSPFPIGETLVQVDVTDSGGLTATGYFTVRVDPAPGSQTVAFSGQPVPGTAERFAWVRTPTLNASGRCVFGAGLTNGTEGTWSGPRGQLAMLSADGAPVPGIGAGVFYGDIHSLAQAVPVNSVGQSIFAAPLTAPGIDMSNDSVVMAGAPGNLAVVAREGDQAPGLAAGLVFGDLSPGSLMINDEGTCVFRAGLTGPGIVDGTNDSNAESLWAGPPGGLALLARSGDPAPGTGPGVRFLFPTGQAAINATGQCAFASLLTGNGVVPGNESGIWTGQPGQLSLVMRGGDPAPGAGAGLSFRGAREPVVINRAGQIGFIAGLEGPGLTHINDLGIWTGTAGELEMVARTGQPAPGTSAGTVFFILEAPMINAAGGLAFHASLSDGGINSPITGSGLWRWQPGAVTKVVASGDPAPDAGADTFFQEIYNNACFNDEGTVVFRAKLGGESVVAGQNDESLWRSDAAGVLTLIVRTGDLLEVTLGDSRTVLDFDFAGESFYGATSLGGSGDEDGRGCGLNDLGQVAYLALFGDNSSAVMLTAPTALLSQAQAWRQQYFGSPENAGDAGDGADPDGDGTPNLLERALGLDPLAPDTPTVQVRLNGAVIEFTYTRSTAALAEISFSVEWSDGLAGMWSSAGVAETVPSENGTTQTVLATIPAIPGRAFVRLKVSGAD
jgi:hypothetical protein